MSRNTRAQAGAGLSRSLLAAASIFALQGVIAPALAQDARAVQSISLEGGSLSEAIVELSRESGVAIFASGDITSGITVGPLSGQMAPYDALERLIEGHGLEINASDRGALIVRKAEEEPAPAPSPAAATTSLSGQVTTVGTGGYLEGAIVEIPSLNRSAETDREGRFVIRNLPAGSYDVLITYQGKQDFTTTVRPSGGNPKTLDVAMLPLGVEEEGIMKKVIVTSSPIADSEAAAYSRQKASDNLVNIIAADTIGRFPDQNVAAALSRVPGVSVERDQGQERYINLRGAPTKWSTISFNGLNIISPGGRTPRFDTVPNAIVSSVETTKAITADMPAESIAGNVNIITRSPFDHDGLMVSGQIAGGYMELGEGGQQDLNLALSNTFNNDRMGFVVSTAHYERDQVTDNIENRFEYAGEAEGTPGEDIIWANQYDYRLYRLNRQNSAYSGRFDWRPNADHELFLSSIYTEFRDHEQRHLLRFDLDDSEACYAQVSCGNTFEEGVIYGVEGNGEFNTGLSIQSILTNTLGGDHYIDGWDVSWRLNNTNADDEGFAYSQFSFSSDGDLDSRFTVDYDYTDPDYPIFSMYNTVDNGDGTYSKAGNELDIYDVSRLAFDRGTEYHNIDMTQTWGGRLDLSRDITVNDLPVSVKFGGSYDTRLKKVKEDRTQVSADTLEAAGLAPINATEIMSDELMFGEFPSNWDAYLYDHDKAARVLREAIANGAGEHQDDRFLEEYYRVQEDISAAYGMATVNFDWGNVVAGLRVEHSENEGQAYGVENDEFVPLNAGDSHTGYFPSVHINYDITEDQKFRLSFNSGVARADFDERAPNFEINDAEQEISGGNPYVKPELAYGVDAYYEWYLKPVGILSAGVFYKYIKDPIVSMNTRFGSKEFNTPIFDRSGYLFNTNANGDKGEYYGIELVYAQKFDFLPDYGLPEWTDGFGFNGNITIVDSEITLGDGRTAPMTSSSNYNYNTSVYWEKYGISARVNWQWRTEWLNSYGDSDAFDRYWDGLGRLSFGARYQLNDNFEFFFDANNLTDQVGRRYRGNESRVYEIEGFGRSYMIGSRFNF